MFKRKETLLSNMAFMGVMAALNVIFSLIATFVPLTTILVMIFLPFFSAAVALLCKHKYYIIYAVATIGVSLAATPFNMDFTLFSLIPSVITGFVFGLCIEYKLNGIYAILFTSLCELSMTYIAIPIINAIYGTDLIYDFLVFFKLNENIEYVNNIIPSFIFLLSLVEMTFAFMVLNNEIKKFIPNDEKNIDLPLKWMGLGLAILVIPFLFFALNISYLLMLVSLYISIAIVIEEISEKQIKKIILYCAFLSVGFILLFALYQTIEKKYTFLLINVSNILIYGFNLIYNLKRDNQKC